MRRPDPDRERRINLAIAALRRGEFTTIRPAAEHFNVSRTTLSRRYRGITTSFAESHEHLQRLSSTHEQLLCEWIIERHRDDDAANGVRVREMASRILAQMGDTQPLGQHWLVGFLQRNPYVRPYVANRLHKAQAARAQLAAGEGSADGEPDGELDGSSAAAGSKRDAVTPPPEIKIEGEDGEFFSTPTNKRHVSRIVKAIANSKDTPRGRRLRREGARKLCKMLATNQTMTARLEEQLERLERQRREQEQEQEQEREREREADAERRGTGDEGHELLYPTLTWEIYTP